MSEGYNPFPNPFYAAPATFSYFTPMQTIKPAHNDQPPLFVPDPFLAPASTIKLFRPRQIIKPARNNQPPLLVPKSQLELGFKFTEDPTEKQKFLDQMSAGFKDLWETKAFSDFTVLVGLPDDLKRFKVHKCILSIRSPVFAAVFKADMKESLENEMKIEDFSAEAVEEFLGYLYTNKISREENAMELFALASKYDVNQLRSTTEKIISHNIKEESAIEIYGLAHLHNSLPLKTAAFATIKKMFPMFNIVDSLIEKPEVLKSLVEARRDRDAKKSVVEGEYQAKVKALGL